MSLTHRTLATAVTLGLAASWASGVTWAGSAGDPAPYGTRDTATPAWTTQLQAFQQRQFAGPPLSHWLPEASRLRRLIDEREAREARALAARPATPAAQAGALGAGLPTPHR